MKKSLLAATAVALFAGSAFAADLPSRKEPVLLPPPPPPPLWTGFYLGLNAGYTFSDSNSVNTVVTPTGASAGWPHGAGVDTIPHLSALSAATSGRAPINSDGFIGGGQIGYNYQFGNSFVAGIEADIQGIAGSRRSANAWSVAAVGPTDPSNYIGSSAASKSLDYLGTVRGRLGFLFTPTLLVYGTGGLAYGGVSTSSSIFASNDVYSPSNHLPPVFGGSAFSDTRVGWTAGGGLEWLFLPNWSAKVEYLYYDLGSVTTNFAFPQVDNSSGLSASFGGQSTTRFNGHIVRAGVNYHFNLFSAPAPVVAKY
ncbi:MAG: porin family protein [Methylocystaceae bacterium]|nr:MAG: porin family protein [Methylocystaceae bacterium]